VLFILLQRRQSWQRCNSWRKTLTGGAGRGSASRRRSIRSRIHALCSSKERVASTTRIPPTRKRSASTTFGSAISEGCMAKPIVGDPYDLRTNDRRNSTRSFVHAAAFSVPYCPIHPLQDRWGGSLKTPAPLFMKFHVCANV